MIALRVALVGVLLLAGCTSHAPHTSTSTAHRPASSTSTDTGPEYYVSIGDSYAAGYQPTGDHTGTTTRNGFAYQVITDAAATGRRLTLVNFGCAGATTVSILHSAGCAAADLGPGSASYAPHTQAAAADAFLAAHRGQVALVSVVVGGNDFLQCGLAASPVACVTQAVSTVTANLATLLTGLRTAGGPQVKIVGLTYPDVILAGLLSPDATVRQLAGESVTAFRSLVNPALKSTYAAAGASFVDVTSATGAYGSLSTRTTVAPYGSIPVPVATVCRLTYSCQYEDIHPRTAGYALIARLVAAELPPR